MGVGVCVVCVLCVCVLCVCVLCVCVCAGRRCFGWVLSWVGWVWGTGHRLLSDAVTAGLHRPDDVTVVRAVHRRDWQQASTAS